MNTGIGDAVNLAWKLAAVLQGRAQSSLLDSYQPERIAFARRLVATTDRAFTAVTGAGWFARFLRLRLAPLLVPAAIRLQAIRRLMFRTVSQTRIRYRASSLSAGHAGRIHGGDRLPWVPKSEDGADNFRSLDSLDWQVHVYGAADDELTAWCGKAGLAVHVFRWNAQTRRKGIRRNAVYLVRPDGYIALAAVRGAAAAIRSYVAARRLSFVATRPADAS